MITLRPAAERGHAGHGWLDAWHTFSFADYYDPQYVGSRSLRVINDDTVAGGRGFDTHPHRDMEIITYILSGALQHRDSFGHIAVMRAGAGVEHSEFNASPTEPVHLLQIWIRPDRKSAPPAYAEKSFAKTPAGGFTLIACPGGRGGSIAINQDADVWLGKLRSGDELSFELRPERHVWLHVATGEVSVNGLALAAGGGVVVSDETRLQLSAKATSEVLLFDLN